MKNKPITWTDIQACAHERGASYWAIRKWLQRGHVPPKWQILLAKDLQVSPDEIAPGEAK